MSKSLLFALLLAAVAWGPLAAQDDPAPAILSPDQLDNLLASVALYPDPLLAQILPASTFPDQIDEAARFVRAGGSSDDIDTQPWDISVRAIAHYPTILDMMADNLDWTTALGQAYVNQSAEVMESIQRLRQQARDAGNLASTPQQDVDVDDGNIDITPAQPQYCYIPIYDPSLVFFGSGGIYGGPVIAFGPALPIGVWLNKGFNWPGRRIYYHGWNGKTGWIARSRPFVRLDNTYVNINLKNIVVNRAVTSRAVNYSNLTRYDTVHQGVTYGRAAAGRTTSDPAADNKMIQRNGGLSGQVDRFRGWTAPQPSGAPSSSARSADPPANAFGTNRGSFDEKKSSERGQSSRSQATHVSAPKSSGGGSHSGGGGGGGGSHSGGGGGGGGGSHSGGGGGGGHH